MRGLRRRATLLTASLAAVIAVVSSLATGFLLVSAARDNVRLRAIVDQVFDESLTVGENIDRLNTWVYRNQGFRKNTAYYLWPSLGPTPIDVLERGGDCADKSRLMAALLASRGIGSTLVMLHSCDGCPPSHTVIEARHDHDAMVVDPVYDLSFPSGDGGYYGLEALKEDPDILQSRLDALIAEKGARDKIAFYRRSLDGAHYNHPKTVNWDKNVATRLVGRILSLLAPEPNVVTRPRFLEDPKLFLILLCAGTGFLAAVVAVVSSRLFRSFGGRHLSQRS